MTSVLNELELLGFCYLSTHLKPITNHPKYGLFLSPEKVQCLRVARGGPHAGRPVGPVPVLSTVEA